MVVLVAASTLRLEAKDGIVFQHLQYTEGKIRSSSVKIQHLFHIATVFKRRPVRNRRS